MALIGLGLYVTYILITFGVRTFLQYRRTGDSGFRGISGRGWSTEWWGGILFVVAMLAGLGGPLTGILGLKPIAALTAPWIQSTGVALTAAGILMTFAAQVSMGASWRVGVDGLVALFVALQIQVRAVEEPYLDRTHGAQWNRYAAATGRFVPWLGMTRHGEQADQ